MELKHRKQTMLAGMLVDEIKINGQWLTFNEISTHPNLGKINRHTLKNRWRQGRKTKEQFLKVPKFRPDTISVEAPKKSLEALGTIKQKQSCKNGEIIIMFCHLEWFKNCEYWETKRLGSEKVIMYGKLLFPLYVQRREAIAKGWTII